MTTTLPGNIETYDQFSLKSPGYIQPHGVLFVLDAKTLKILQLSENTESFLGIKFDVLLGKHLTTLLSQYQLKKLLNSVNQFPPELIEFLTIKTSNKTAYFKGIIHAVQNNLILELEPRTLSKNHQPIVLYNFLKNAIANIQTVKKVSALAQNIATEIKKITQFDRVMIYQFETDNSGVVIAEAKQPELESYLGLHYPKTDIPAPARQLYTQNWLRLIPDVNYQPIAIIPAQNPHTNQDIDLSNAVLRSVSPCHLEYLKNMGVTASMSISLMNEQQLWGLIACHHYSPKYVNYETRKSCEILGKFMSINLINTQEQEFQVYKSKIQEIQTNIRRNLVNNLRFIDEIIADNESNLINLVQAEGVVIALGEQLKLIGKTPSQLEIKELINEFLNPCKNEVFYTDCLSEHYPKAEKFKAVGSGILVISIFLYSINYHIIWFKPEQLYNINWAGNLEQSKDISEQEISLLCPRNSFEIWKELVKNKSLPWGILDIEAAQELRNILLLTALEFSRFSQVVLEKEAHQANAANLAKSQFLAKMSHELRTPLNAILGFTQIMTRDYSLSSDQQEYLQIINRSGEHLLSLINDVLEMSRIEAGQLTLHQNAFDLHILIQSIRELLTLKALSKGLELIVEQRSEVPKYVAGDQGKLRQIIVNLVDNAIKFTHRGKIWLYLSVIPQEINSKEIMLQLEVKDTGVGISSDELELIFEPFKQIDNNSQFKEGTGLGLSISRQFARLMGGDITVKSELGQGSTFTCTIKMIIPTNINGLVQIRSQRIVGLAPAQPEYRILVVEDIYDNQLLMVRMLTSCGFKVQSANNGQEAINVWEKWQPHLIWMDMRMPIMDGYEASQIIRNQEAKNPNLQTPVIIIALTATAFNEDRKAILDVGCNDFVRKPFQEQIIFEMIEKYLGVKYIYEDILEPELPDSSVFMQSNTETIKSQMALMSPEWIEQLYQAALTAREKKIMQLINEIPANNSSLAKLLIKLVNNLDFEKIMNFTQVNNNE